MGKVYDINSLVLVGRLTHNPELKYNNEGKARVSFSIANNRGDDCMFIKVHSFGKVAESIAKFTEKGSRVAVSGRLTSWKNEDGQTKFYVIGESVQFMNFKEDSNAEN